MVRAVKTTADKAPATPVPITDKQPKAKKAKAEHSGEKEKSRRRIGFLA